MSKAVKKVPALRRRSKTPPAVPGAAESPEDARTPLFQIEVGKTEIYQGELVPISASLFVPRSVMLRRVGLIEVNKSDFAIARFPQQADQTETVINGVGYIVVTYRSMLSALHAGDLKVGPASCELLFEVYDEDPRSMRRSRALPGASPRSRVMLWAVTASARRSRRGRCAGRCGRPPGRRYARPWPGRGWRAGRVPRPGAGAAPPCAGGAVARAARW